MFELVCTYKIVRSLKELACRIAQELKAVTGQDELYAHCRMLRQEPSEQFPHWNRQANLTCDEDRVRKLLTVFLTTLIIYFSSNSFPRLNRCLTVRESHHRE